ncbi:MAG TPA: TerB family tellurite resistance protein [Hanamia sp.]|nr:TerB family tellurite resistance protein [Hanamia sp.]
MKKIIIIIVLLFTKQISFSQSQEAKQLLLDVEKLAQFKQMLSDLEKGYEILSGGYEAIKNISQGNFNLHQTFLDGLLKVSPTVQKYERIADIINYQLRIVKEYKAAFNQFKADKNFTSNEVDYMGRVYNHLFNESVKSLNDLLTVITAGKLRMSDDERLNAIDHIWNEVQDQYAFLKNFNGSTAMLSQAREKEQQEVDVMRKLVGGE